MLNVPQLDSFLREGGVLLVPNHHGAQQWQDRVGHYRCEQSQRRVVAAPAIHAIDLWLTQLWQQLALNCAAPQLQWRVLSTAEEELLWQRLLDEQSTLSLLNTMGTARSLREANTLLQLWQVTVDELRGHLHWQSGDADSDTQLAWRWLKDFEHQCEQQQLLCSSKQLSVLLQLLQTHSEEINSLMPPRMWWLGFDDPPPLYLELQQALQKLGVELQLVRESPLPLTPTVKAFVDSASELRAAASWCEQILQHQPLARIGIISPNLYSTAPTLLRIFAQHLPAQELYCSVSPTLGEHPFFNAALQSLQITDSQCESLALCQWLRSPWLRGANEEAMQRSALELRLRKQGELQTQITTVRELCSQQESLWHCPVLAKALPTLQSLALRHKQAKPLNAWLELFQQYWQQLQALELLQEPQHHALHGAWQRWCDALMQCSSLFGAISRERAIALLQALASNIALPHTQGNAAVRILTPVEAAGLNFTHLWVLQLHTDAWPAAAQPNALLPLKLQRERAMPAADSLQELQRAELQWQSWQSAASEQLILSYPQQVNDLPVEPTPFIRVLPVQIQTAESTLAALHPAFYAFAPRQLILHSEVTVLPPAAEQLQGPSSLLSAQSQCPFKAFATYRLGARELPEFQLGLPPSVVGELLHKVLQQFWLQVRESLAITDIERTTNALQQAISDNLRSMAIRYPATLTPRFRELEEQRLFVLLTRWLAIEQQRRPFTVLLTEPKLNWCWENLQLNMRLDRIDHNEHGVLVVDYKTGRIKKADWQSERPRDPQLLLYQAALAQKSPEENLAGLLYARITLDELSYSGITESDEGIAGLTFDSQKAVSVANWASLQQHWQHVLGALAQEYLQGLASVDPQFADSCQHCHLPALCRIDELRRLAEAQS